MMSTVFALIDCNNFYVSCERVFNPWLAHRPVIVLSNNDGCAVSRSNEAKQLGIKVGTPVFKIQDMIKRYGIEIYSSNYALYGDMSRRVMQVLCQFSPGIEIYSIDEAFLDLSCFGHYNMTEYGHEIRSKVEQWTGIPVSVGIAETKTLAKIANRLAKKSDKTAGVLDLTDSQYQDKALEMTAIEDVWGIGFRYARFLKNHGINNALQLRDADSLLIRKKMGILGIRLLSELKGFSCYPIDACPATKKEVTVSRSFKHPVKSFDDLAEAVSAFVSRGAEKLRNQHSAAGILIVYVATNRFKKDQFYFNLETIRLLVATNDTTELIQYARKGLRAIYKKGYAYKKAGIVLRELVSATYIQSDFFDCRDRKRSKKMMKTLDSVNILMGTGTLKYASAGLSRDPEWKTVFQRRSPAYTTNWDQLPKVS